MGWVGAASLESQLRFVVPAKGGKRCLLMKESLDLALRSLLMSASLEPLSGFWEVCGGRV